MNLGQALGELHLRIDQLEQRRGKRGGGDDAAEEIAEATGIDAAKVQTNVWHLVRDGKIARYGEPGGHGRKSGAYRYWLAERALPEGVRG